MADHEHNPLSGDLDEILSASGDIWESFRGSRIFITGGTGFFGRWLLESLLWANKRNKLGLSAVAVSRNPEAFAASAPHLAEDKAFELCRGDVRSLLPAMGDFTHLIHAATESSGSQKHHDRLHMVDTIVGGTRRVLDYARKAHVKRMLYISSSAVYGRDRFESKPIAENDSNAPLVTDNNIEYDEAKRMAEALCIIYGREFGLAPVIARCFPVVGPHLPLNEHFAIGNFIRDALSGGPIKVHGDGTPVRSYLYAADLALWLWTLLAKGTPSHPYNVGSDEAVTIRDLAQLVKKTVNPSGTVNIAGRAAAAEAINYQIPDIARSMDMLGIRPRIMLEQAITRTAEWNRKNPQTVQQPRTGEINILATPDAIIFDFDGVMTDNRVLVFQDKSEAVMCDRGDGLGIEMLRKRKIPMLVLSKEKNPVVAARCKKLQIECLQGIDEKPGALRKWLKKNRYDAAKTIYVGNDINDLGCMQLVGCAVAVGDAVPEAKALAHIILQKDGGKGAVRELADKILGQKT